jgi:hypothetical protein
MQQLTHRGLGTSSSRLELHSLKHWEAAAADGQSLSYAAPHQLQRLDQEFGLLPLPHPLGIHETLALIAQATTLQVANPMLDLLRATLRHHPQAVCDGMEWLRDDGAAAARSSLAPA